MYYEKQKIGSIIRNSIPKGKTPKLTPAQVEKIKTVSGIALAIVGVAGIIALSAVAPNMFVAIDKLFLKKGVRSSRKRKEIQIAQTFYYLKRSGLIRMRYASKDYKIFLTKFGAKRLKKLNFQTMTVERPDKWDGKWWQIAADIPTKEYRRGADLLRQKLKEMNFYPLQRTLWFYPYDPRQEIEFIVVHYEIERFVTVMEISRLDKDDERKMKVFFQKMMIIS